VVLGGDGELFLTDDANGQPIASVPAGATWIVVPDSAGTGVRLLKPDGTLSERHAGVAAVNVTEDHYASVNGTRYRGRLDVFRGTRGLVVMNRVKLESYLAGVLSGEMGPRRPDEINALLAQAIVSRTFAVKNRGRWEAQGFDAYSDTRDQVYGGVAGESPQIWDALRRTTGVVATYDGQPIDAFFHSTCGYSTAAVDEAFRSAQPRPYLRPVSDASGGGHYYCDISPRFHWREEWDGQSLRAVLARTLAATAGADGQGLPPITDLEVTRTTKSGRVGELRIVFAHGDLRIAGADVRSVLRPEPGRLLNSAAFQLYVTKQDGVVTHLVAAGAGSGHGVGMCQWGAIGRARAGQDYEAILRTYFPGTKLARLY
jgi:stage II sporulation protein D (peptidoglycan lytic transglycosylase)